MISADMYQKRRKRLYEALNHELVVVSAFDALQQTNDSAAPFVQESNFFWLTGINEPGWQLFFDGKKSYLVTTQKTEVQRIFDGEMSAQTASNISGIKNIIFESEYKKLVKGLSKKNRVIYTIFKHPHSEYFDFTLNPAQQRTQEELEELFDEVKDCRRELAKLKAIKSSDEIELIRRAIDISITGFKDVRKVLPTAKYEYEIEATLSYAFRSQGSGGHAYEPIVGVGKNACTLHYIANSDPLPENGIVLIDAGAKVDGYAADITRTYAIGSPTQREKDVHKAVAWAHESIIKLIKPGLSFKDYEIQVDDIMKQALRNLDLLKVPDDYRLYFPHAISHGLGIDVHDSLGGFESLQPGMVLTVEPGIYIPEEGIGVRIEDDILVTEAGNENLSQALPISL